ncbi:MAG TPA: DUF1232 domain-containing protein [Anaerolineales bacterium]|jgi:uncharacterized membrane protein YkvA (DUF1232 family)|nr:DUF1232 domain-containing protein [Anaerolineales bacterium]
MADKQSNKMITPPQGGMLRDLVTRLKLIGRLMADRRVNIFVKLLPLASLAYLFSPVDLIPGVVLPVIGALDDAAILWIGSTLFVELCPPKIVEEHINELASKYEDDSTGDVVDAESTDVDDQ